MGRHRARWLNSRTDTHLGKSVGSVSAATIVVVVMMIMSSFETASASATSVIMILRRRRQLRLWARLLPIYIQKHSHKFSLSVFLHKSGRRKMCFSTYRTYPIRPSGRSIGIIAIPEGLGPRPYIIGYKMSQIITIVFVFTIEVSIVMKGSAKKRSLRNSV